MNPVIHKVSCNLVRPRLVVASAPVDQSNHQLEDMIKNGVREIEWRYGFEAWQNEALFRELGSVCPVCFALDGQHFKTKWLLENMRHNAPIYTMSHCGCGCKLAPVPREEELLDFSDEQQVGPSEIEPGLIQGPITLDQVPEDQRQDLGLPEEQNEYTDLGYIWDPRRNEFVPMSELKKGKEQPDPGDFIWDEQSSSYIPRDQWSKNIGV